MRHLDPYRASFTARSISCTCDAERPHSTPSHPTTGVLDSCARVCDYNTMVPTKRTRPSRPAIAKHLNDHSAEFVAQQIERFPNWVSWRWPGSHPSGP